jgi:hypothetical protein
MTDIPAAITKKLAASLRMLSSDSDGDLIAAGRAIIRLLKGSGADIHALAARIETLNGGGLTDAEMRKLYDAGYSAGVRDTENRQHGSTNFHNVDGTPDWHEIARSCQQRSDRLSEKEQNFINDMTSRTVWREPTEKQAKWLRSIFYRLGGRI